jgi:hypothetical protein
MGFIAFVLVKKSEPLFMFEFVIPVKLVLEILNRGTGIQVKALWIPAFEGMTRCYRRVRIVIIWLSHHPIFHFLRKVNSGKGSKFSKSFSRSVGSVQGNAGSTVWMGKSDIVGLALN